MHINLSGNEKVLQETKVDMSVYIDLNKKIEKEVLKTQKIRKFYWMRAGLKWHSYKPFPASKSLEEILEVIEQDSHGCFWG